MQKIFNVFLFLSLCVSTLFAQTISIASYNVENLFDLKYDGTEYKEYIPNSKYQWNQQTYTIKLQNTAKVLNDMKADIVALQEIESAQALENLVKLLPQYPYKAFTKNPNSVVGLAIISKYPITKAEKIVFTTKVKRPIQKVTLLINNQPLIVFNNHWASKRHKESQRVNFALHLQEELKTLAPFTDYLLVGDFNSNYNEYESIRFEKRLNDTNSHTGINHVLNTLVNHTIITKNNILEQSHLAHYNPWYELPFNQRFSNLFRQEKQTPDHILLSKGLFDQDNFSYVNNSFKVFHPNYLYHNNKINRWQISKKKIHLQKGYSDHLPILLSLEQKAYKQPYKVITKPTIKSLYQSIQNSINIQLSNVTVIYQHDNHAIIKDDSNRAIFLYNCAEHLKESYQYDLIVQQLKNFQGLMEIIQISNIKEKVKNSDYKKYYLNGSTINLHDLNHQNEIITNLQGQYHNGYLHYGQGQKIRLYSKEKSLLPKNGQNITIINTHLGYFKNQAQLIIYKQSDFSVN